MQENRAQFDTQFDLVKSELKTALGRIEKFTKLVTVLQGEMKLRDEALKRVPSNTHQILKDLNAKMDKTMKHVDSVDQKFVSKIDAADVDKLLGAKLDCETFTRIFPSNKQPQEHLKNLIRSETESFNDRVLNMIKLWDQKISNLRSELNIQSIYRKLGTFPRKDEVDEKIQELHDINRQTDQNILQLKIMIGKVGQLTEGTQNQINSIYDRQKEVIIGKRNVNCLSCAKEPNNKHGSGRDGRIYQNM